MMQPDRYLYCLLPKEIALATKIQAQNDQAGITVIPLKETYNMQFKRRMTSPDGFLYAVVPIRKSEDYQSFWKTLSRTENNRILLMRVAVRELIRSKV